MAARRSRPYGPRERLEGARRASLIALEDQLLSRLAARGCGIRPPPPWWQLFAGDMHHRVRLEFDAEGALTGGVSVPRKGPRTEGLPPEMIRRIDAILVAVIEEARGERWEGAPKGGAVSLYLPLRLVEK